MSRSHLIIVNTISFPCSALKVGDKYLINGRWSIALKKDVRAAGTRIKYRLGKGPGSVEIMTAAGPTTKELKIVVCKLMTSVYYVH